jgi:hypothetical protein
MPSRGFIQKLGQLPQMRALMATQAQCYQIGQGIGYRMESGPGIWEQSSGSEVMDRKSTALDVKRPLAALAGIAITPFDLAAQLAPRLREIKRIVCGIGNTFPQLKPRLKLAVAWSRAKRLPSGKLFGTLGMHKQAPRTDDQDALHLGRDVGCRPPLLVLPIAWLRTKFLIGISRFKEPATVSTGLLYKIGPYTAHQEPATDTPTGRSLPKITRPFTGAARKSAFTDNANTDFIGRGRTDLAHRKPPSRGDEVRRAPQWASTRDLIERVPPLPDHQSIAYFGLFCTKKGA